MPMAGSKARAKVMGRPISACYAEIVPEIGARGDPVT
jgi:hypothetical protein